MRRYGYGVMSLEKAVVGLSIACLSPRHQHGAVDGQKFVVCGTSVTDTAAGAARRNEVADAGPADSDRERGHADLIVSGDGDLLALNPFRQIPIVTPAAFVQGVAR